jgi:hypothetical protein
VLFGFLADLVVITHACFVAFVVLGGLAFSRWPRLVWVHAPMAAWGVFTEFAGVVCPLTPLENALRVRAGGAGYSGDFIEHHLIPVLYPAGLTRALQLGLGAFALALNGFMYWRAFAKRKAG